jgi:nitrate reductase gamma subunit
MILWVLLVQLLLGLFTIYVSTAHMDGSQMVLLANWAQQIVTFQPVLAAASMEPVGLAYKLHVFLGITLFVLFPFTRLVHVVSAPVWYLGRRYQIVRLKGDKPRQVRPVAPAYEQHGNPTKRSPEVARPNAWPDQAPASGLAVPDIAVASQAAPR